MTKPVISLIIPCLNEEDALPLLLRDIAKQTFANFEVLIVDAKSDDQTPQIAKQFTADPRFQLITTAKRNVSHQRNLGAAKATSNWLVFFDADTRIRANFLAELIKSLEQTPCDACNPYALADSRETNSRAFVAAQNLLIDTMAALGIPYAVGACFVCKAEVFKQVGGFNPTINHMEDSELARRIKDRGFTFRIIHHPKYVYSLRRLRQEGTLSILVTSFPYYLKSLVAKQYTTPAHKYPMQGGSRFKT